MELNVHEIKKKDKQNLFHLISSVLWSKGDNGGLVIWRPCGVGGSNPTVDKIFL